MTAGRSGMTTSREMFSAYSEKGTGNDVNNVFWKYYDREIPVPAL